MLSQSIIEGNCAPSKHGDIGVLDPHAGTLVVAYGKSYKNHDVSEVVANSFSDLLTQLQLHPSKVDSTGPYICAPMKQGIRNAANAMPTRIMLFDFDYLSPDEALRLVTAIDELHFIAVTWSTRSSTADKPRLRLMLELSTEVSPQDYPTVHAAVLSTIAVKAESEFKIDPQSARPEQPQCVPLATSKTNKFIDHDKVPFDVIAALQGLPPSIQKLKGVSKPGPKLGIEHDPILKALDGKGVLLQNKGGGCWEIACPWANQHTNGDLAARYFEPYTNGYAGAGFHCFHTTHGGKTINDLKAWLEIGSDGNDYLSDSSVEPQQKKSASTVLVELARQYYTFGISTTCETFAIPKSGPKVVLTLRDSKDALRGELAQKYFQVTGRAASQQAFAAAFLVIDGMARASTAVELHLRVARLSNDLWLDLGDASGLAVRINGSGWSVEEPTVLFKRTSLIGPLPLPAPGGTLDELWDGINVNIADRPLIVAWLVAALFAMIPHPVLTFTGEQGTGKTTAAKKLVLLLDPGPVPIRKPPRDPETWVTAAAGSWIVVLDNLSDIKPWLSDSICRAVTGDGDVRRKLYTDGDHSVFAFRRAVILTSIDLGATRGDLGERMLPVQLDVIPEEKRLAELEIWTAWKKAHPRILGALLDLVAGNAGIAGMLSTLHLASKPRMADFALILAAVDKVLGTDGLNHYLAKQTALAADSLSDDPFVIVMTESLKTVFEGSATDLLKSLSPESPPKGWPSKSRIVTTTLKRHSPALRKAGWKISCSIDSHTKVSIWKISPPAIANILPPHSPQSPQFHSQSAGQAVNEDKKYVPSQDETVGPLMNIDFDKEF